jgi:hypothetical protein
MKMAYQLNNGENINGNINNHGEAESQLISEETLEAAKSVEICELAESGIGMAWPGVMA